MLLRTALLRGRRPIIQRIGVIAAVVLAAVSVGASMAAYADHSKPDSQSGLKDFHSYAPILWLATDERAYPLLPHAFAFDGIDNDRDGCFDIEDPDEIRFEWFSVKDIADQAVCDDTKTTKVEPPPNCDASITCQNCRPTLWCTKGRPWGNSEEQVGPQRRVLVAERPSWCLQQGSEGKVQSCPETSRGDHQEPKALKDDIGKRVDEGRPNDSLGSATKIQFRILQYWFYYPFDDGPGAHRDDAELAAVFLRTTDKEGAHIQALVGAGHADDSLNNILVTGTGQTDALLPRRIEPHTPILVELGKHASTPDRNCNGRFDLGLDANLYPEGAWGSRDVWSGNVGQALKVGDFKSWYSYSRTAQDAIFERGWRHPPDEYRQVCRGTGSPLEDVVAGFDAFGDSGPDVYDLFPLSALEALHAAVDSKHLKGQPPDLSHVQTLLDDHADFLWQGLPAPPAPLRLTAAGLAQMRYWTTGRHRDRREIWLHDFYTEPDNVFRLWLLRRIGVGFSVKGEARNAVGGFLVRLAELPIPVFQNALGRHAFHDSRLEFYVHFDELAPLPASAETGGMPNGFLRFYDAGLDVYSGRNRRAGWFVGLTTKHDYTGKSYHKVGLNAGIEVGFPALPGWRRLRPFSLMLSVGGNAQLFESAGPTPRDAAVGSRFVSGDGRIRAFVGLRLTYGLSLWRARHPLAY